MRRRNFIALLTGTWFARPGIAAGADAGTAGLRLATPATTSAGIFDSRGRLIRTLWSGRTLPAGPVAIAWDGRDDDGAPVAAEGRYQVRLLSHDIRYEWEGVIGNTSTAAPGTQIHRAYGPINHMAIDALGNAFYVVGYNEQQRAMHRFDVARPQEPRGLGRPDVRRVFRYVATDGELVYFANMGLVAPRGSSFRGADTFVVALRVNDDSEHVFPGGTRGEGDFQWASCIDYEVHQIESRDRYPNAPSGLAVQQRGELLLVSHQGADQIRLFDKRDGRRLGTIPVDHPGDIAIAPDDSFWVICRVDGRATVARFRPRAGQWVRDAEVAERDLEPLAIGVSPLGGTLLVADGRSEQLRAFDDAGHAAWTLGSPGGYRSGDPQVSETRFGLSAGETYVAFQPDGSFWVGDPANQRNLHFSRNRQYLGQIQYLSHSYVSTVDSARPARVFNGFLEFEVDPRKPLRESWQLVRNWSVGLDSRYRGPFLSGLRAVITLANGRSYGTVFRTDSPNDELVELAASGLRPLGLRLRPEERLYPDGRLRSHVIRLGTLRVHEKRVEGFDASGVPRWAEPTLLAEVSGLSERDPWYHEVPLIHGINDPSYPSTGSGLVISFNPGVSQGFHLGALFPGEVGWRWRASPTGEWQVSDTGAILVRDGRFGTGLGVQYPANVALAAGSSIIYGYHGEAWNGGQANQWMHFHESGLFLGQFGHPTYPHVNNREVVPGSAGNAFSPSLVQADGRLYLWHNDESVHGGIHRWRIHGVDTILITEMPIVP